jgi:hypothetical protein
MNVAANIRTGFQLLHYKQGLPLVLHITLLRINAIKYWRNSICELLAMALRIV